MKVSIEGILGSAQKINSQKKLDEESLSNRKKDLKTDSVSISNRINSRLDSIEGEFRELQSSLTRNQIVSDGIEQLRSDMKGGGRNQQAILNDVKFEGNAVLRSFVGDSITEDILNARYVRNQELINADINGIKRLQVELDNIMASDLAGQDRIAGMAENINSLFPDGGRNLENISRLNPDAVMRLIK